jgi:hypothetical protein
MFTYLAVFVSLMPLLNVINASEIKELARLVSGIPLLSFLGKVLFEYQRRLLFLVGGSK